MVSVHSAGGLDACYPAQGSRVADIRGAVANVAVRCGAGDGLLERIGLAVSEAATNVVLHAYRKDGMARGDIHVTATCREERFFDVRVRDDGIGMSPRTDSPGLGLGLSLMAHEADALEIRARPDGGTEVQLRFALA